MTRRNAFAMVYVDEVVGEYIKGNFPVERTLFLPNGGYEAGFVPPMPDSSGVVSLRKKLGLEGKSVILYAGQLTAVYRLDILVSAAPSIISRVPTAKFVIIGSGPTSRTLKLAVKEAHLEDYFDFTGAVPYDELSPFLVLSDLCVQLLDDWCMGTKVVMYMVHRRPVISSGGWFHRYGRFLRNGENSILIPPSVEAFGEEAVKALQDPLRRAKIGESAWTTVRRYTWDEHAEETLKLLHASILG